MIKTTMAVVAVTALATACGDKQDAPTHPDAPAVAPSADASATVK